MDHFVLEGWGEIPPVVNAPGGGGLHAGSHKFPVLACFAGTFQKYKGECGAADLEAVE